METPVICRSGGEFRSEIVRFQGDLFEGRSDHGLHAEGQETMGGIRNAPAAFTEICDSFSANLSGAQAMDIARCGYRVMDRIVSNHLFQDGNGRTSMYAMYLFAACWGYRLGVPPLALHAFLFGESQKDSVPQAGHQSVVAFMTPFETEKKARSHLSHIQRKLKKLEDSRKKATIKRPSNWKGSPRKAGRLFLNSEESALTHIRSVTEIADMRAAKNAQSKRNIDERNAAKRYLMAHYLNLYSNPFSGKAAAEIVNVLSAILGHTPNDGEIDAHMNISDLIGEQADLPFLRAKKIATE